MQVLIKKVIKHVMRGVGDSGRLILEVSNKISQSNISVFAKKCMFKFYPSRSDEALDFINYEDVFSWKQPDITKDKISLPRLSSVGASAVFKEHRMSPQIKNVETGNLLIAVVHLIPDSKDILFTSTLRSGRAVCNLYRTTLPYTQLLRVTERASVRWVDSDKTGNSIVYIDDFYKHTMKIVDNNTEQLHFIDTEYLFENNHIIMPILMQKKICFLKYVNYQMYEIILFDPESLIFYPTGVRVSDRRISKSYDRILFKDTKKIVRLLDINNNTLYRILLKKAGFTGDLYDIAGNESSVMVFYTMEKNVGIHYCDINSNLHFFIPTDKTLDTIKLSSDAKLLISVSYKNKNSDLMIFWIDTKKYLRIKFPNVLLSHLQISSDNKMVCFLELSSRRALYGRIGCVFL